jgi:uncharacterized protein YoxC
MDPQLLAVLRELQGTLQTIAQNQQQTFVVTIAFACVYLLALCLVAWRLDRRMERRFDEGRKALADLHATSQAIVAQTAELLRRTAP